MIVTRSAVMRIMREMIVYDTFSRDEDDEGDDSL